MTPYYAENNITIYHGDCRDILPQLPRVDLVLTDPPYGIGSWSTTGGNSITEAEAVEINRWDVMPTPNALKQILDHGKYAIVWGGNYFDLGRCRAPLVWDKGQRGMHFADGEMAWTNFDFGTLRILNLHIANGGTKGQRYHPTQKPVAVMKWSISQLKDKVTSMIDPYLGSGSSLVAAKDLGPAATGIEISEQYAEIAANRLRQEVLQFE